MTDAPEGPQRIAGRYVLHDLLGAGGSASVYRATDTLLGVERAIKLVHSRRAPGGVRTRVRAEARAMARVDHPNVLRVYDVGTDDDEDYVVMDLASGGTLADLCRRGGPMQLGMALRYLVQILAGLAAAHAAGIVHRDVKPQNVLLDQHGVARLADFGIALLAEDEIARSTRTGAAMGTLAFMAPEQRLDARSVGPSADLYAAAATLFHLVTGDNPVDLFTADAASPRLAAIPGPVRDIVVRGTRYATNERYATAPEMAADVIAALDRVDPEHGVAVGGAGMPTPAPSLTRSLMPATTPPPEWFTATDDAVTWLQTRGGAVVAPRRRPIAPWIGLGVALVLLLCVPLAVTLWPTPAPAPAPEPVAALDPVPVPVVAPSSAPAATVDPLPAPAVAALPPPAPTPAPSARPAPQKPAPAPSSAAPFPLGRWTGSFNGRPAEFVLSGDPAAVTGTVVVRFGTNSQETPVRGTFVDGNLHLEDTVDVHDAGAYVGRLAGDRVDGRFEGRYNGRVVPFQLEHVP